MIDNYTETFKALSDITRLKIVWLLSNVDSKICVSEIIEVLDEYQYNVSRHLRILKHAGLISEAKEGRFVFYYLKAGDEAFRDLVLNAIRSIPESTMQVEVSKCRQLLKLRE